MPAQDTQKPKATDFFTAFFHLQSMPKAYFHFAFDNSRGTLKKRISPQACASK
jgi:hypothetical protein